MSKNPAFMYYPKDWRSDPVWGCSLAARGLWHEMMDRMHESERYGYLVENGRPIPHERVARMVGAASLEEFETLLAELLAAGVPRKTASGVIYSKRMVEDEQKRAEWRGKNRRNYIRRKEDSLSDSTPIHSRLAFAFADKEKEREKKEAPHPTVPEIVPITLWLSFVEMRKKIRHPLTEHAGELIRRKLRQLKDQGHDPVECLENSIRNGWRDVFEPKEGGSNGARQPNTEGRRKLTGDDLTRANLKAAGFIK